MRLIRLSGTSSRRAALISRLSAGLMSGLKQSSPGPSQLTQARMIALRCFLTIFDPVTSAATFSSSLTFQSIKASISGWSISTTTIFAARRVVPPDLIAPAARSPILKKDIRPEEDPPPDSFSFSPRSFEKFVPVPEPYLNKRASRTQRSMMPPSLTRSSSID